MNILEMMIELEADGVDFVPIIYDKTAPPPIIESYTREQFKNVTSYPRTAKKYWKIIDKRKVYIIV